MYPSLNPCFNRKQYLTCECICSVTTIGLYRKCQRSQKFASHSKACVETSTFHCLCGLPSSLELFGLSWTVKILSLLDKNHIVLRFCPAEPTDARWTAHLSERLMPSLTAYFPKEKKKDYLPSSVVSFGRWSDLKICNHTSTLQIY